MTSLLWNRYFRNKFIKLTFVFLFLSYTLFVIADLINRLKDVCDPKTSPVLWLSYYAILFVRRSDILVPFSAGLAAAIIITKAIHDNTLIPLRTAGLSLHRFLLPFFTGALFFTSLLWINYQWIYPTALRKYSRIIESDFGRARMKEQDNRMGVIMLPRGERLFFYQCLPEKGILKDVFWYVSEEEIYHIDEVTYITENTPPVGKGIEYCARNQDGSFSVKNSLPVEFLHSLSVTPEQVQIATSPPKELSLSSLFFLSRCYGASKTERAQAIKIALYSKALSPLLTIAAVIFSVILSFLANKRHSIVLPLLGVIVLLFLSYVVLQAANILARSPFLPTGIVLLLPWILFSYIAIQGLQKACDMK